MIKKDNCWIWSYNPLNSLSPNLIDKKSVGKWLIYGSKEYMEKIFPLIDELIDNGQIYKAKYSHRENKNRDLDPFYDKTPVLCVYADDNTKEATKKFLMKIGVLPKTWKYDSQTIEDWLPNGKLYQEVKRISEQDKENKVNIKI